MGTKGLVYGDDTYDPQLERTLTASNAGMADLGEALATARSIKHPTPSSWHDAWLMRADQTAALAAATSDPITRRDALLRASEYYRQSFFFLRHDVTDQRLVHAYGRHAATFRAALPEAIELAVPYEGVTLKAYLFVSSTAGDEARPTILAPCGYDSTAEEGYAYVSGALRRGYHAVTFEGPGQGAALYLNGLTFRPDFAPVLSAVIDHVVDRPEVGELVLHGLSFAGYLAPQAAAFEHRLAALICNPAQPDMAAHLPAGVVGKVAPTVVRTEMKFSDDKKEFFGARMATHGIDNIEDYFAELRRFNMLDVAGQITCPTLILDCEGDFAGGGGKVLQQEMNAPTTLIELTAAEGAGGHCGGMGQNVWEAKVYDWLATTLAGALPDAT